MMASFSSIYFKYFLSRFHLQELERLSQKFGENVLDATKKFEKLITDKKEIEGLPATALGLAAQTAVSKVNNVNMLSCYYSQVMTTKLSFRVLIT